MKKRIIDTAFKTKLDPNNVQATALSKAAGCARFAYNWALNYQQENYESGNGYINKIELQKIFVAEVKKKEENSWFYDSSKCAPQQAIRNLDTAYKRFFKGKSKHPKFKKKNVNDSFYVEGCVYVEGDSVRIPQIGLVKCFESLKQIGNVEIKSATIRKENYEWFISFSYKTKIEVPKKEFTPIGGDLGIKAFATLSDGKEFETPKKYIAKQKKLSRLQRKLARQSLVDKKIINKNGKEQTVKVSSKNREKTKKQISKIHRDIRNHRMDVTHKATTYITKNHSDAVFEDLFVSGMMRNHKLARSIANSNFGEIRRQLEYKGIKYGCTIFIANRFFASSKTCSRCDHKKEHLKLSERTFRCEKCGLVIDRDLNAARNLEKLLYLDYKEFSKLIINCSRKNYNAMRKRFLASKNNKTTMSSIGIVCGDPKVSDSNESVKVNETKIKHRI